MWLLGLADQAVERVDLGDCSAAFLCGRDRDPLRLGIRNPQHDCLVAVERDRSAEAVENLHDICDPCLLGNVDVKRQVIARLFCLLPGKSCVSGDMLQRACDAVVADFDILLQIRVRLSEEIVLYGCRYVSCDQQPRQGFTVSVMRTGEEYS